MQHTNIASDNSLSPVWRQAIMWTNAAILSIRPKGTYFNEIFFKIQTFSIKKIPLKMSAKWQPFCPGLNVIKSHSQFADHIDVHGKQMTKHTLILKRSDRILTFTVEVKNAIYLIWMRRQNDPLFWSQASLNMLTNCGLSNDIHYITNFGHQWFRWWLVAWSATNHTTSHWCINYPEHKWKKKILWIC